jgi:hypothetical protein
MISCSLAVVNWNTTASTVHKFMLTQSQHQLVLEKQPVQPHASQKLSQPLAHGWAARCVISIALLAVAAGVAVGLSLSAHICGQAQASGQHFSTGTAVWLHKQGQNAPPLLASAHTQLPLQVWQLLHQGIELTP